MTIIQNVLSFDVEVREIQELPLRYAHLNNKQKSRGNFLCLLQHAGDVFAQPKGPTIMLEG
jgi:hypothetical protein